MSRGARDRMPNHVMRGSHSPARFTSSGTRTGALRLWMWQLLVLACLCASAIAAEPNGASDMPVSSLKPPRPEMPPTTWEQYGGWIIAGSVLAAGAISFAVWLRTCPKEIAQESFAIGARRELETLTAQKGDTAVLSRASQVLRTYISRSFGLSAGELTTREICDAVSNNKDIGPELAGEIVEFLRGCDLHKFSPTPPQTRFDAAPRALTIIDKAENRLAAVTAPALDGAATGVASTRQAGASHDSLRI